MEITYRTLNSSKEQRKTQLPEQNMILFHNQVTGLLFLFHFNSCCYVSSNNLLSYVWYAYINLQLNQNSLIIISDNFSTRLETSDIHGIQHSFQTIRAGVFIYNI